MQAPHLLTTDFSNTKLAAKVPRRVKKTHGKNMMIAPKLGMSHQDLESARGRMVMDGRKNHLQITKKSRHTWCTWFNKNGPISYHHFFLFFSTTSERTQPKVQAWRPARKLCDLKCDPPNLGTMAGHQFLFIQIIDLKRPYEEKQWLISLQ